MREIIFTEEEVEVLSYERYHHPDPGVQRCLEILWLKHHGFSHELIATLAGCSRSTVQRTLSEYLDAGLPSIVRITIHEPHSELDEHRVGLEELFQQQPPRSVKHAQHLIEQRTGIRRGLTQVRHFLH